MTLLKSLPYYLRFVDLLAKKEYTYIYDEGRFVQSTECDITVNEMTYDSYGNIRSINGKTYTYGDGVWKDLLTGCGDLSITYDAQGNPTNYLGNVLTWEKGRQLKTYGTNSYTYNANGIRTSKTVGGVTHTYTLDGTRILKETWGGNTLIPLYDNEESVCGIEYNGTPYFFQKNLQGDIIGICDMEGSTLATYRYDAWGVCWISENAPEIAQINPYRYRSYYYDAENQFYYLQSRYYDPWTGRFINGDEPETACLESHVSSTNLYAYCKNSCITHWDESGMFSLNDLFSKISSFLKGLFNKLVDKIKAQFQRTKKYIKIGVTLIKLALDIIVSLVVNKSLKWGIEKVIGFVMKKYIQKSPKTFIQFLGKVLNHSATKWLMKALVMKVLNLGSISAVKGAAKSIAIDSILSVSKVLSKINSICSSCTSVSGMIAFILDFADGKWDDYLTITFA